MQCFVNPHMSTRSHPFCRSVHCVPCAWRLDPVMASINDQSSCLNIPPTAYSPSSRRNRSPFTNLSPDGMEVSSSIESNSSKRSTLLSGLCSPFTLIDSPHLLSRTWSDECHRTRHIMMKYVRKPPWVMMSHPWPRHISYSITCGLVEFYRAHPWVCYFSCWHSDRVGWCTTHWHHRIERCWII